ncbi:MAG: alpha/beta hydrolase family esterase [Sulfitobacter sp.]
MRAFFILVFMWLGQGAAACGVQSDCTVGGRSYRISLPENGEAPRGAVIWAHGHGGSAAGVMGNGSLRRMAAREGFALIALEAAGRGWDLPYGPRNMESTGAEEFAYVADVIEDSAQRFGIDPSRIVASGFSAGAMLVWNLACARPGLFAGFVPISGTYWMEPPAECARPVASIVHIHGDNDGTVPLEGRAIGATHQGRVRDALAQHIEHGNFGAPRSRKTGDLRCDARRNVKGDVLEFCLFSGGHSFRTEYLRYGLQQLQKAGRI